jgi:choline-sulfatase
MQETVSGEKNVVFLVLDSLRKDRVSAYNDDVEFTEHIQPVADSSVVFENAVSQAPWTLPSHVSMFTGEYPWEHGTTHARSYFEGDRETFVSSFDDAGYATAAITPNIWITPHKGMTDDFDYVQNFLGKADNGLSVRLSRLATKVHHSLGDTQKRVLGRQVDRLFRLFGVDDACKSEETVEATERYLDERPGGQPFFLYVNLMEPHEPYDPPNRYTDRHGVTDTAAIPQRQKDIFTKEDIDFDELGKVYDASVDYADDLVGRVVEALERNGLADDTVVVLLSDHGQALGEGGAFGHQFTVMEPVVNAVLMVAHPEFEPGRRDRPIELRALNGLVPFFAGLRPRPDDIFAETVLGGCEFPENFTGYIPRDRWDQYYRKHRYAKRDGTKVVKSVTEDGEQRYEAYDTDTGATVPVPPHLKAAVDNTGDAEAGEGPEPDEQVQRRLEKLGYK